MRRKSVAQLHDEKLKVSERIGVLITNLIGTLWTAILFALLTLVSLPAVIEAHSPIVWISWITQTFLQLVLLPVIIVGQNVSQKHSEALAQAMYEADIDSEKRIIEVQEKLEDLEIKKLDEIIKLLKKKK